MPALPGATATIKSVQGLSQASQEGHGLHPHTVPWGSWLAHEGSYGTAALSLGLTPTRGCSDHPRAASGQVPGARASTVSLPATASGRQALASPAPAVQESRGRGSKLSIIK